MEETKLDQIRCFPCQSSEETHQWILSKVVLVYKNSFRNSGRIPRICLRSALNWRTLESAGKPTHYRTTKALTSLSSLMSQSIWEAWYKLAVAENTRPGLTHIQSAYSIGTLGNGTLPRLLDRWAVWLINYILVSVICVTSRISSEELR